MVLTLVCFQVVAALGDSITAGVGARANSVLDIFTEYRYPLHSSDVFSSINLKQNHWFPASMTVFDSIDLIAISSGECHSA